MKTLIQQLQDGEIAVKNDGSLKNLRRVLRIAFPQDLWVTEGNYAYYHKHDSNKGEYYMQDYTTLKSYSTSDFIKELDNKTSTTETITMKTITAEQAQSIIDIACITWRSTLAKKWSTDIVLKKKIDISEKEYLEMREACTKEQHQLFDKIFGKDEPKFKVGDWVIRTKENGGPHKIGRILSIKSISKEDFTANEDREGITHMLSSVRKATPEEIKKVQYYPDGTPCLVRSTQTAGWDLRYANGHGEFYLNTKKSGETVMWKYHMKLDMNNLPVN